MEHLCEHSYLNLLIYALIIEVVVDTHKEKLLPTCTGTGYQEIEYPLVLQ